MDKHKGCQTKTVRHRTTHSINMFMFFNKNSRKKNDYNNPFFLKCKIKSQTFAFPVSSRMLERCLLAVCGLVNTCQHFF